MSWFLIGLGILMWVGAGLGFMSASTSIHQIIAAIFGVSGSVVFVGGAIVECIQERIPKPAIAIEAAAPDSAG